MRRTWWRIRSSVVVGRSFGLAHEGCPCAVGTARFDEGAEGENGLPADDAPSHAGAVHSVCHERFCWRPRPPPSRGQAGADGDAAVAEVAVSHAHAVLSEEGEFALDGGERSTVSACLVAEVAHVELQSDRCCLAGITLQTRRLEHIDQIRPSKCSG